MNPVLGGGTTGLVGGLGAGGTGMFGATATQPAIGFGEQSSSIMDNCMNLNIEILR